MAVTRKHLVNCLNMYLDDYVTNDNDVKAEEMDSVKKSFDRMWSDLREEAESEEDEDEEEDDDFDRDDDDTDGDN